MKVSRFFLFSVLVALSFSSFAQHFVIQGSLQDAKTSEPLPFANAGLYRPSDTLFMRGATTDMQGKFLIKDVAPGSYMMRVSVVGYEPFVQLIEVKSNTTLEVIRLHPGTTLKEVEIVADRPLFSMDGEKNIYNTGDDPSIQTGTASDALQNAPGIEIDADGNITFRGTQSVDVWINDRPSHMEGEALKQYIKMLPANSIQKIEVISNPSARYGGGTPVVNIVTNQKVNRNQFVSFGLNGTSRPDQHIWLSEAKPWVSYVFANEKFNFNIYANFGYSKRESEYNSTSLMLNDNHDTARFDDYHSTSERKSIESYIGGHLSYTINSRNSLGAWYGCYPSWSESYQLACSQRHDYQYDASGNLLSVINNTYEATEDMPMTNAPDGGGYFGAWYEHKFDESTGHKINFNLNGNGYSSVGNTLYERRYEAFPANNFAHDLDSYYKSFSISAGADYLLPFGRQDTATQRFPNELSVGADYSRYSNRSWNLSTWSLLGPFIGGKADSLDRDKWSHNNNVSLYATYQRRFGNLTAKIGLRGNMDNQHLVYYNVSGYDADTIFWTLTPSLHLSYSTKSMHNFSLSFTRRVSQPGLTSLTLYKVYEIDGFGSWGNPDLVPSYNQHIEFQWDKYFMKFGSIGAELYYSSNTNEESELANVVFSDFYGTMVGYTQPMNIGNSYAAGLDLNVTYRPTSFINVRFSGSLTYSNEDFTFRGQSFLNSVWSYHFRLNAWAKLWKNYQFFVNAHYGSPTKSIFTTNEAHKGIDFGVNADFFDRKLTINLNVHDIFNQNAWATSNDNPYLVTDSKWKPTSRFITLGITLRFGKMELQSMAQEGASSSESAPEGR